MTTEDISGPHHVLAGNDPAEQFTATLFDRLWSRYRDRVEYVRVYEDVVRRNHATFVNDHIAFRTIACQNPHVGVACLTRPFVALGYRAANIYYFEDKSLFATHLEHPRPGFPKLFISELHSWKLGAPSQAVIAKVLAGHRAPLSNAVLSDLANLAQCSADRRDELLGEVVDFIERLPWNPPCKEDVTTLNSESQYGAWVLVHGYNVNHFTSLVNSHGVPALADIEKTAEALRAAGVPMKDRIEGAPGSILRQTATAAAVIDVPITEGERVTTMPWTYAYFELAERGMITDPATGAARRFEGFLGAQATHLFEMTRRG